MKRFNVSILAVVAVLAIGLTAFTKAETKMAPIQVLNCYDFLETELLAGSCTPSVVELDATASLACNTADQQLGKRVSAVDPLDFNQQITCNDIETVFCCAQLIVDPSPCAGQSTFNFTDKDRVARTNQPAKIHAIFCKIN
jgi:uncharacterized protein (UPF0264 family)